MRMETIDELPMLHVRQQSIIASATTVIIHIVAQAKIAGIEQTRAKVTYMEVLKQTNHL